MLEGSHIAVPRRGGFGALNITRAVTIDGTSNLASVLGSAPGLTGITVNAGPNDDVVIPRGGIDFDFAALVEFL